MQRLPLWVKIVNFTERWSQSSGSLKLSSLTGKGKDEGHSALIGLALSDDAESHRSILDKIAGKKFGGGSASEGAQWGLTYLDANSNQRDQMVYELVFRGQLLHQRRGTL